MESSIQNLDLNFGHDLITMINNLEEYDILITLPKNIIKNKTFDIKQLFKLQVAVIHNREEGLSNTGLNYRFWGSPRRRLLYTTLRISNLID